MRPRPRRLFLAGVPLLLWGGILGACGTKNSAIERGGECLFATDCAPGLVCVHQKSGKRICTDDLSGFAGDPPPGAEEDSGDEGGEGEGGETDGPPPDDTGADQNAVDTGTDSGVLDTGLLDVALDG